MCTTCGCSTPSHSHQHEHEHDTDSRLIEVEQDLLAKNDSYAEKNRALLASNKVLALNLVSSPGSGKTSLLTATIEPLKGNKRVCVIEGDQQTDNDAQRIIDSGAKAIQINTGKGCHLDAHAVGHAMKKLELAEHDILFIENVGNLVCPAAFDLGEHSKVVVLSVTEGEDKPLKYPDMFKASSLMLINKSDLLPYVDFDVDKSIEYARRINPDIEFIVLSAKTGDGMKEWLGWLNQHAPTR
ncbi:hydrogenase accessory protein HypB [Oleiphilus sp. HI0068]|jgi:hydrogenase nickel incorporation protein HypB|nr:hydrogenase accessory protein HypB [Oleiphilus sp. HI0069]KZY84424.1 hydrogenase accessory protein HypB [Oleiphilus sp. HI0068]KZZ39786.1 hydrogenase accessory protein HypB [Oleiphilus sp. HI0085]